MGMQPALLSTVQTRAKCAGGGVWVPEKEGISECKQGSFHKREPERMSRCCALCVAITGDSNENMFLLSTAPYFLVP